MVNPEGGMDRSLQPPMDEKTMMAEINKLMAGLREINQNPDKAFRGSGSFNAEDGLRKNLNTLLEQASVSPELLNKALAALARDENTVTTAIVRLTGPDSEARPGLDYSGVAAVMAHGSGTLPEHLRVNLKDFPSKSLDPKIALALAHKNAGLRGIEDVINGIGAFKGVGEEVIAELKKRVTAAAEEEKLQLEYREENEKLDKEQVGQERERIELKVVTLLRRIDSLEI